MNGQGTATQAKANRRKYSAREITTPSVKRAIFESFERDRIRTISQNARIRTEYVEQVIREGVRELRASGAVCTFRTERVSGFGKPIRREIIAMPVRETGRAA